MSLYWKAGFERGDLSEVESIERASTDYGGWGGAIDPNCIVRVATNPRYNGNYVAETLQAMATPTTKFRASNLKQSTGIIDKTEVYCGVAVYVPSAAFPAPIDWVNFFQLQEAGGAYRIFAYLVFWRNTGEPLRYALCNDWAWRTTGSGGTAWLTGIMDLPVDRWFTAVVYSRSGVNGNIKLWIDGVQKTDWNQDFSGATRPGPGFSTGIYGAGLPAGVHLYVDEMRCASTLQLATPVPSVSQHNLSITSNPSGLPFTLRKTI